MSSQLRSVGGMSAITALRWKYLQEKDWSQAELARQVDRSESSVSLLLSGRTKGQRPLRAGEIPLAHLVDAALGIPLEELQVAEEEDRRASEAVGREQAVAMLRARSVRRGQHIGGYPASAIYQDVRLPLAQ